MSVEGQGGSVGQAAVASATQGNGQPSSGSGFNVPQGHRLVSDQDYEQSQRWRQQVEGSRQEFEKYRGKYGAWEVAIDTLSKAGVDPKSFAAQQAQASQSQGGGGFDQAALEQAVEKRMAEFESKMTRATEMRSHEASMAAQRKALDKLVDDVASGADEATKKAVRAMALGMYNEALQTSMYPDSHLLRQDTFAPLSDEAWGKFGASVGETFKSLRGAQLGAVADAAVKANKTTGTGAGASSSGSSVKAKPTNPMEALLENAKGTLQRNATRRGM